MRRLHLCFVGPAASVTLRRWAEWFAVRGHQTTILTVEPASPSALGKLRQITLGVSRGPARLGRLVSAGRLAIALRRLKPDLVHAHYVRGLAWGLLLARWHPCVVTPWGSDVLEEQGAFREWYSRVLTRKVLGTADLVTVHSAYLERQVRPLLPPSAHLARIGWGVDLVRFRSGLDIRPLRQRWEIGDRTRVILSPRLAQPFYNHDLVIKALPLVLQRVSEALLVVSEQSPEPDYVAGLKRLVSELGVTARVRFVGAIPYEDMPLWYNLSTAAVMVPRSDGMPNSLLEAMACGVVPVLGRLPQYGEIVRHGINGFLVEPTAKDLAEAIVTSLSDPELKDRMARTNRALTQEVADQDKEMSRMEDQYLRLARGNGEKVAP